MPTLRLLVAVVVVCACAQATATAQEVEDAPKPAAPAGHLEVPDDPYQPVPTTGRPTSPRLIIEHNGFVSVQVNIDDQGQNIIGDAANEPSIAVDPTDRDRMAIGWRQFDTIENNFRQAGWGYTVDGGQTWTFPGRINPGVFRSDPVLAFDTDGNFYYNSLTVVGNSYECTVYKSTDGRRDLGRRRIRVWRRQAVDGGGPDRRCRPEQFLRLLDEELFLRAV